MEFIWCQNILIYNHGVNGPWHAHIVGVGEYIWLLRHWYMIDLLELHSLNIFGCPRIFFKQSDLLRFDFSVITLFNELLIRIYSAELEIIFDA